MEAGAVGIQKEEREEKRDIYVEEYVLSYLKREADSLELSDIYFYGLRKHGDREIFVYGAGREKGIDVFAKYELLTELVCRLTQAGPVFMVRGEDGSCKAISFQIFYANNEAMQNFLIEWTSSEDKNRTVKESDGREKTAFPLTAAGGMKKHTVHGAISVQLCLILVALVAIVISSTDSYDKMEQLGQSAKEVFFAIENQETGETAKGLGEQREIVVERDAAVEEREGEAEPVSVEGTYNQQSADVPETAASGLQDEPEGVLAPTADKAAGSPEEEEEDSERAGTSADSAEEQETEKPEDAQETETQSDEENTEALSRSITRYYEVQRGDTLYTISQEIYGDISRVGKICEINQISDPDKIRFGQKIILP